MGNCASSCCDSCGDWCPSCCGCNKYKQTVPVSEGGSDLQKRSVPIGSMVHIYKQDPSIESVGVRTKWLPINIDNGPSSSDVVIQGLRDTVRPTDNNRNFLYDPTKDDVEFDAVNTFAIVTGVIMMYRQALKRMGVTAPLQFQWGDDPIRVYPRAGELANAMYSREHRALAFYYFRDSEGKYVFTGRSFDIVAHETGHAVLDSLLPQYLTSNNPESGALHESFGDLTAIFALLNDLEMCEAVITQSKGNLHNHSFFSIIGEEFGLALGRNFGLRNADENLSMDQVSTEVHDLSRVFTSAVYDILVDMYEITRNIEKYNPAETLYRVGKHLCGVYITAFLKAPRSDGRFRDIANLMIKAEQTKEYKDIMVRQFEFRKIRNIVLPANADSSMTMKHLCGTMEVPFNSHLMKAVAQTCDSLPTNSEKEKATF